MVSGLSVDPFDQLEKIYSLFGVAVNVMFDPSSKRLPGLFTVPPVEGLMVKLYCCISG